MATGEKTAFSGLPKWYATCQVGETLAGTPTRKRCSYMNTRGSNLSRRLGQTLVDYLSEKVGKGVDEDCTARWTIQPSTWTLTKSRTYINDRDVPCGQQVNKCLSKRKATSLLNSVKKFCKYRSKQRNNTKFRNHCKLNDLTDVQPLFDNRPHMKDNDEVPWSTGRTGCISLSNSNSSLEPEMYVPSSSEEEISDAFPSSSYVIGRHYYKFCRKTKCGTSIGRSTQPRTSHCHIKPASHGYHLFDGQFSKRGKGYPSLARKSYFRIPYCLGRSGENKRKFSGCDLPATNRVKKTPKTTAKKSYSCFCDSETSFGDASVTNFKKDMESHSSSTSCSKPLRTALKNSSRKKYFRPRGRSVRFDNYPRVYRGGSRTSNKSYNRLKYPVCDKHSTGSADSHIQRRVNRRKSVTRNDVRRSRKTSSYERLSSSYSDDKVDNTVDYVKLISQDS